MSRKSLMLIAIMAVALMTAACGQKQYEPVAINEETDQCAICNMAITDDAFATQIITKDGRPFKFDDLGCMYEWFAKNGTDDVGIAFVRDYDSKTWLKLEDAYYVYSESFSTPMAYGVVSFAEEASAQAFIAEHGSGSLLTAEQLADHTWESHGHAEHDGHGHDAAGHGA